MRRQKWDGRPPMHPFEVVAVIAATGALVFGVLHVTGVLHGR